MKALAILFYVTVNLESHNGKTFTRSAGSNFDDEGSSTKIPHASNGADASRSIKSVSHNHHQSRSNMRINLMVILTSFFYIIGTAPYSVYYIMSQFMTLNPLFSNISYLTLSAMHGTNIFIFYFFNKLFRQVFNLYARKILLCFTFKNHL